MKKGKKGGRRKEGRTECVKKSYELTHENKNYIIVGKKITKPGEGQSFTYRSILLFPSFAKRKETFFGGLQISELSDEKMKRQSCNTVTGPLTGENENQRTSRVVFFFL